MKIKKNDKVKILSGKDKGKEAKVIQVLPGYGKVVIEGLNLKYKNLRPRKQGEQGQKIEYPGPMSVSNVTLICPKCNKTTRVGYKMLDNKKKVRICKKCKSEIE